MTLYLIPFKNKILFDPKIDPLSRMTRPNLVKYLDNFKLRNDPVDYVEPNYFSFLSNYSMTYKLAKVIIFLIATSQKSISRSLERPG